MNKGESRGVVSVCPPSISGNIVAVHQTANCDILLVRVSEVVAIDVVYLEREGVAYKIVGRRGCFAKHGLDVKLVQGLPVMVWVRPAWCHVVIEPYDRKPVVWR